MAPKRPRVAIYFASHDGQTRKIVDRLAGHLGEHGVGATIADLSVGPPTIDTDADIVLLAAAIRYGFHLSAARRFLGRLRTEVPDQRIAVISVNLTARKPGRQTAEGNVYLRNWLKRTKLRPALAAAIAGRLDYPAYRWFDRMMIQAIMTISGGPTDPSTVAEYTDWAAVERLADALAALATTKP
ncbi:menaquinone-dependent protoporphyrinogen IX dehydrogenase [Pleomorphomonas diazotrophica]|uniref:Menaquinone-dependent protoporphyrinogen IX dehydrogenase n=1 Tax=Pleomorphomonas diazotrophica TaxID=1166257 RepID=A0A1I4U8F9_9HYPH|nr:menaquinone-dependent protoporphyrinogen IX dehydrogenase [Pleomorphomonas diazotrophica]PKR91242.1 menaquinone-dependent protoporphyrinogen IX dehydrogenase [Pleomorphomonas diazotrophica]SFM85286.1 protoporphyrinogen oxidase [Pleomorphomonas diazotrophica]